MIPVSNLKAFEAVRSWILQHRPCRERAETENRPFLSHALDSQNRALASLRRWRWRPSSAWPGQGAWLCRSSHGPRWSKPSMCSDVAAIPFRYQFTVGDEFCERLRGWYAPCGQSDLLPNMPSVDAGKPTAKEGQLGFRCLTGAPSAVTGSREILG